MAGRLSKSLRPVLMIGIEVHRFNLRSKAVSLAQKMGLPVVSSFMARNTFPVHHSQFAGIYIGPAGPKKVQRMVEKSDCLILLGVPLADTDMAMRLKNLKPDRVVTCVSREVSIGHHHYDNVPLADLMEALLKLKFPKKRTRQRQKTLKMTKPLSYFG